MTKTFEIKDPVVKMKKLTAEGEDHYQSEVILKLSIDKEKSFLYLFCYGKVYLLGVNEG